MTDMKMNILLVEDDNNLGLVVQDVLEMSNYKVSWKQDGRAGLKAFYENEIHLCVLDIMLPEMDGFSLASEIRKINNEVPIVFLTAKGMQEDRIKGYKSGADDYITKPFSTEEFLLRIEAVLNRCYNNSTRKKSNTVEIGKYVFDYQNQSLSINGKPRNLTKREAEVLNLLYINRNEILKRESILNIIWGSDDYFSGRSMDVFITRLRKYLKEDNKLQIENVHGVGFKMIVPELDG